MARKRIRRHVFGVRLTVPERDSLSRVARALGMDRAAAVRYAIEWLERSVAEHVVANSSVANVSVPATRVAA